MTHGHADPGGDLPPRPTREALRARWGPRGLLILVVLLLAGLVFLPTALVFVRAVTEDPRNPLSTFTLHALADSYGSPRIWRVLAETMAMSLACGILATVLGGALAWILARTDVPCDGSSNSS